MGRKNKNAGQVIATITADELFDVQKPRYNAHQTGHGVHKNKKAYSRKSKYPKGWE